MSFGKKAKAWVVDNKERISKGVIFAVGGFACYVIGRCTKKNEIIDNFKKEYGIDLNSTYLVRSSDHDKIDDFKGCKADNFTDKELDDAVKMIGANSDEELNSLIMFQKKK